MGDGHRIARTDILVPVSRQPWLVEPIAREFEQFERDENVFDIRVDDVPVWERLRLSLYYRLRENEGFDSVHGRTDGVRPYLQGVLLGLGNLFVKNPFLASDSDMVFVGHPRRKE